MNAHETDINCVRFIAVVEGKLIFSSCDDLGVVKLWSHKLD